MSRAGGCRLDGEGREHLDFWRRFFRDARPRIVEFRDDRGCAVAYTDGAEEASKVGIGGVLTKKVYFVAEASQELVEYWKANGDKHKVIHQAEVLPAVVALRTWGPRLRGRRLIIFVDNGAAKAALVKGSTTSSASAELVTEFWSLAAAESVWVWVDRVPTKSNPADAPSRGERVAGARRVEAAYPGIRPLVLSGD